VVFFKTRISDAEQRFTLCSDVSRLPKSAPSAIVPPGLDRARREYLFKNIRPYVEDPWKDVMCPEPEAAKRKR
jgi:hypothetical protein